MKEKKRLTVMLECGSDPDLLDIHSKKFPWDKIIDRFSQQIKANTVSDIFNVITNNFTTTGPIE